MHKMEEHGFQATENESSIDLSQYIRALRRRKWNIILITCLTLFIGLFYLINASPVYQASAKIQADPIQPNASAQDSFLMNSLVFLFYETQYEIIKSRKVAETVVDKLNLVEKYKQEASDIEESEEGFNLTENLRALVKYFSPDLETEVKKEVVDQDEKLRVMLASTIQAGLNVDGGTQSQIINITYQDQDPVLAAQIVNATSESYIEFGLESRLDQIKDTAEWLTEQLDDLRKTLQESEDKLQQFRLSQNLMDTEQQQQIANTQLQTLNTELVKAQTKLSEAQELYSQVLRMKQNNDDYRSLGPVLQNNTIRDLVREESTLNRKVKELSERYGEKHPKMIAARSDLISAQANLEREVSKVVDNIEKEFRLAQVQEENIKRLIKNTTDDLQSYQGNSFELTRLEREVENNRRIYENFLGRLMEADVSGDYDATNIRIIDKATVPDYPVKPKPAVIVFISIFVGVFLGIVYSLAREFMDEVFRTPDDLERELGIPSLGVTPLIKQGKNDVAAEKQYMSDQRSTFSEAINTIRTGLLFSDIDNPPKTILITSTNGSEGKTTLAINLAVALSQLSKTLLIELDLRKPAIARDLGIEAKPGLSDLISNKNTEISFQKINDIENLDIITCGSIPPNPMELISSKTFNELIERLKEQYEHIVIDSPPTLPVSDSCVLAKNSDATIIAVKAEETKISMAKETLSRLQKVNAKITGVVLTQASAKKMSYYGEHYFQDKYYGLEE